ncbi:GNAT family N-acetyltransferase [Roseivirga sp.]|uniref:GNAT family N-acetyltransferase n=1 Tax=Roseivirga sp. TaxID=1964215 RepID=UPI002B264A76|nr:GNAT family N-acetyltransferase [Roseivirga sp.]
MPPILRPAQTADIPELQALYKSTIESLCINDYSPEQIRVWAASAQNDERWEKRIKGQYFIVATINDEIVGFASLENGNYIDMMYVHYKHLRKGIANLMMDALEKEAETCRVKELYSNVSKTAKPFFEQRGFQVVKENWMKVDGISINNYKMVKQNFQER